MRRMANVREQPGRGRAILLVGGLVAALLALGALWRFSPLGELLTVDRLAAAGARLRDHPLGPWACAAAFALGAACFVPVTLLIGAAALVFSPLVGTAVALGGAWSGAFVSYALGRATGRAPLGRSLGPRFERLRGAVTRHGLLAVVLARLLPVGNFAMINMLAGAIGVRPASFAVGNLIGLAPGVVAIMFFAGRLERAARDPSVGNVVVVALVAGALVLLSLVLKRRLARLEGAPPGAS